jgi:OOP family OmpA-OmpF porin
MQYLNKLFIFSLFTFANIQAQDRLNPWTITFGTNFVDTRASAGNNVFAEPFKVKQNWNSLPLISHWNVGRYLSNNFSVSLSGSLNKISKYVNETPPNSGAFITANPGDFKFFAFDASLKYSFMQMIKSKIIDPSLSLGLGYTWFGNNSYFTTNAGLGFNFWITKKFGISTACIYKYSFGERNIGTAPLNPSYWQHNLGFVYKFGGKDSDKDGIYDIDDACPEKAGLKEFNGCPDSDGDGVMDKEDFCPAIVGSKTVHGCPDADNDNIADMDDRCPNEVGTAANHGCPEVDNSPVVIHKLNAYEKTINFDMGTAAFQTESKEVLESIVAVLKDFPDSKFIIQGHTDNSGSSETNSVLSQERANAVKKFLVENGIAADRLTSIGYGETRPTDSDKTEQGRDNNRRVEVKLVD